MTEDKKTRAYEDIESLPYGYSVDADGRICPPPPLDEKPHEKE